MKKLAIVFALCVSVLNLSAQTAEEFKNNYNRQVKNVGAAGIGVETILNKWAEAYPEDRDMLLAKFSYYFTKSQKSELVVKDASKYLGQKPVLTLKDSLGKDINYFEEISFDESLFSQSLDALNLANSIDPKECSYRLFKISALISYEKDDPALAVLEINKFIDEYKNNADFSHDGVVLSDEVFCQAIAEYCMSLFEIASESSYKYFFEISKKMNKLYPKDPVFINNLGSYYLAYEKNSRKAQRYYKKVLKLDPENYAATTNMKIIRSLQSKKGQSSK